MITRAELPTAVGSSQAPTAVDNSVFHLILGVHTLGTGSVHRNIGSLRGTIPYVVVVQSSQFDVYRRRVVVPLVLQKSLPAQVTKTSSRLNPIFEIERQKVVLHPLDMVSVATDKLGEFVTTLTAEGLAISDALDDLLTRTWR